MISTARSKAAPLSIQVAEVPERQGILRVRANDLLKIDQGFIVPALLRREDSEIVQDDQVVRPELARPAQLAARLLPHFSLEVKRPQVVVGLGGIRVPARGELERLLRLVEISPLHKLRPVRKKVATESRPVGHPLEGQRFLDTLGLGLGNSRRIRDDLFGIERSLVDLSDESLFIDQKRRGKREIAVAVEEVTIEDVIAACHVIGGHQNQEGELILLREIPNLLRLFGAVDVDRDELNSLASPPRPVALIDRQLLLANRRG